MRVRAVILSVAALALAVALGGCGGSSGPKVGPPPCRWHVADVQPKTNDDLTGLSFPDDTHGWAVGGIDSDTIRATTNGGRTWHAQHAAGTNGLDDVSFVDDRHGWAVGGNNLVLTTSDGGAHWTVEHSGLGHNGNLYGVWFVDADHGWIIGSGGVIETTADGGKTWTAQQSGTRQDLESVQFLNRRDGWIQSDGEILRTTNGGVSWTPVYTASSKRSQIIAAQMFLSPTLGFASGSQTDSSANHGLVSRTTDGGRTWTTHDITAFDDVRFDAIAFTDAQHGWVGGYQGELFYTDNGGISFAEQAPSAILGDDVLAMVFHGPTHGWAVGEYGAIVACTA